MGSVTHPCVWVGTVWVSKTELEPGLRKDFKKENSEYADPYFPFPPQKGFAGGKVSLRDCFSLFTKEEELESENAPVRGVCGGGSAGGDWLDKNEVHASFLWE